MFLPRRCCISRSVRVKMLNMPFCLRRGLAMVWSIAGMLACAAPWPARALEPAMPMERFSRQAWTMDNGLPQNTVPVGLQ